MTPSCRCTASNTTTFRASRASSTLRARRWQNRHPRATRVFKAPGSRAMTVFKLPDLGEGLSEAEIVRWHVKVGDHVQVDAPMLSIETAKAVVEVPAPGSGTIVALHAQPGDRIEIGAPLVEFAPDRPEPAAATANTADS